MARSKKQTSPVEQVEPQVEAVEPQVEEFHAVVEVAKAPRKAVKTKRTGVGAFVVDTIKSNIENKVAMTNDEILKLVHEKFGDEVKTTKACIAWYQTKVRGEYL